MTPKEAQVEKKPGSVTLKENKVERMLGITSAVFGLVLAFLIIPAQISVASKTEWYNQPRFFPYVISGIFVLMGILLFISGCRKAKLAKPDQEEDYSFSAQGTKMVLITLGIMILYVSCLSFLPYIPCTIVGLAVLMWFFGQRDFKKLIPISIVLPIIIYLSFTYLLKLRLP